jgi:hypothetical protein
LEPKLGDRLELRVVDESLARALYQGIPAARLLARTRPAAEGADAVRSWEGHLKTLLGPTHERARRALARHARVAEGERPLPADDATIAVLSWAVASAQDADASLAEVAPAAGDPSTCDAAVLAACAAYDERLADQQADRRAPAFEACVRLATRATIGPLAWERVLAMTAQLERLELGVALLGETPATIFPRRVDDEIATGDRRMTALDRLPLDTLVAKDPRKLGSTISRGGGTTGEGAQLATFVADLGRLLVHPGTVVAALLAPAPEAADEEDEDAPSWIPAEWTPSTAAVLADALERGATTVPRVRAAAVRGGEAALDAIGAEMLLVGVHASASAAFADILSRSGRPRDVLRLVTYFAIAPDPVPAARALGACAAVELPRVLGAWLDAMLPHDAADDAHDTSAARVTACIASLKPYPQLYRAVRPILARLDLAPISG